MSRVTIAIAISAGVVAALIASAIQAATFRVDDSATIPQLSSAPMKWRQSGPGSGRDVRMVVGETAVQLRLNMAPWQGHVGRVYMVLPETAGDGVTVQWTTQGRLLPGQLTAGQRVLIYNGPVLSPVIDEKLALRFEADATRIKPSHRLTFHFEIDVD